MAEKHQDSDYPAPPTYRDIEKKSRTAPTRICTKCETVNGCTAWACMQCGQEFKNKGANKGWRKGDPNAYNV